MSGQDRWGSPGNMLSGMVISPVLLLAAFVLLRRNAVSGPDPLLYRDGLTTMALLGLMVSIVLAACAWGPYIELRGDQLRIQNPLFRHDLPTSLVAGLDHRGLWFPRLILNDGRKIRLWALDMSLAERSGPGSMLNAFVEAVGYFVDKNDAVGGAHPAGRRIVRLRPPLPALVMVGGWLVYFVVVFIPAWRVAVVDPTIGS